MTTTFYLRYTTSFGESLFITGDHGMLGNWQTETAIPLIYLDNNYWYVEIEFPEDENVLINYKYILKDRNGLLIIDGEKDRKVNLLTPFSVIDIWNYAGDSKNVYYTQPFKEILVYNKRKELKLIKNTGAYVEFRVKCSALKPDETICLIGQGKILNNWSTENPKLLTASGEWFITQLDLNLEIFPFRYKYGIYNTKSKSFIAFENGGDRILTRAIYDTNKVLIVHDGFVQYDLGWKGAGVAIPVFSLRSKESFGTGEFSDLKLLVDWAKKTGLKLIQLLPVNDTTANHSEQDSYPYAAISAFALNPLYINLSKIASITGSNILKEYAKKKKQLNELADLDYEQVMRFKYAILKDLYEIQKNKLTKEEAYIEFVNENISWLKAYAAFCFLRDKNGTANYNTWKFNSVYDEEAIEKMFLSKNANDLRFYFFIQYHLHLQLKEAVKYAHDNHIVIKGDIPIGVFRNGCDSWMHPELFHMDQQSGAPPDDFAIKGQNWGFPTYNWRKMQEDDFRWWKQRFQQMNNYFDAFRIDHILGFFRIWSIPLTAVEGILGKFSPAIGIQINEFYQRGIKIDIDRFCNPFINDAILTEIFGSDAEAIKSNFLETGAKGEISFKTEFNNQKKIEDYFNHPENEITEHLKQGLFDLHSNVILLKDDVDHETKFHFRIAMEKTSSFNYLDDLTKDQLKELYINYFYQRQDEQWRKEAMDKLPALKASTDMLICGEDLGMVPACVPDVMNRLGILSLEIQRMPNDPHLEFFHPKDAPYMSVVTPSTHDMSTIRGWWEEDRNKTQRFYHYMMGHYGEAPIFCEGWINREIVIQHLYSPAMWAIFQLQDILGMDEKIRRENPAEERINQPADSNHYWRYRMHLYLEYLLKQDEFNAGLKNMIVKSERE